MSGDDEHVSTPRHPWGKQLERARLQAGYRIRKDLADASGVAKNTIDELEQGKRLPRAETLRELRKTLPSLPVPLDVTADGAGGLVVHLPMDPDERAQMLTDLLQQALADRRRND